MTERSTHHATFVIERVYDAAPARVFAAWAEPEAHGRWFVHHDDWPIAEYRHDFRVGGHETGRFSQTGDTVYSNDTRYEDIVTNERIVFAYSMACNDRRISVSLATVEFLPEAAGTRLIFTEQGAFLDGADTSAAREAGWSALLDSLGAELRRKAATA